MDPFNEISNRIASEYQEYSNNILEDAITVALEKNGYLVPNKETLYKYARGIKKFVFTSKESAEAYFYRGKKILEIHKNTYINDQHYFKITGEISYDFKLFISNLTEEEFTERKQLLELQKSKKRYLTTENFERLLELSNKMYTNNI